MEEMPDRERLTRRERLAAHLTELLRALRRNSEAFTGVPDHYNIVGRGPDEAEQHANDPQD